MSRTFRRRGIPLPEDVLYEVDWYCTSIPVKRVGKDLKRALARYRADSYDGDFDTGNCPSYYRKMVNRGHRAKDSQELRRLNRLHNIDEHLFVHWKNDAGWDYW